MRNAFRALVLAMLLAVIMAWLLRERIADDFIADTLRQNDVRATYTVESIAPGKQVLTNIVIGDPARPDLTVERVEVLLQARLGLPDITELRLTRPRLYGTVRDGEISFGALDPLVFTGEEGPFEFPALQLVVNDGRALLETDFGRVGVKLNGSGHLRGGFRGELAAVAPTFTAAGCSGERATFYGEIAVDAERPEFRGPVRLAGLECEEAGLALQDAGLALDLQAQRNLSDYEGDFDFAVGALSLDGVATAVNGDARFTWRGGDLNARYDVVANNTRTPFADIGEIGLEGHLRALDSFDRFEVEGVANGAELRMGPQLDTGIARAAEASRGTLAQPLLDRLGLNLARELRGSTFAAEFTARRLDQRSSLVIPNASLRGGSGDTVVALSRGQIALGETGLPRFSGNFQTAGNGLPRITGRMEQDTGGALELRMAMREYAAGQSRLAIPELRMVQGSGGEIALNGRALASGPLPGGFVQRLQLPIDATISARGDLALWRGCRQVRFDSLALANVKVDGRTLSLCPRQGQPILRYGSGGLQFAAGTDSLELSGSLAETPIRLQSGPVAMAWPGALSARDLDISLGPADSAQRFIVTDLRADLSAGEIGGDFVGADVFLASVPLDIRDAAGDWRYTSERLQIANAGFRLEDREARDRFEPLVARDAGLSLFDNLIEADAVLREPVTGQAITSVDIVHNLDSGTGHADLVVQELTFGDDLQPAPTAAQCIGEASAEPLAYRGLTCLALGVVSNVEGTVSGTGRIDWNGQGVTSTGQFSSSGLDLAAAFGPVRGASGTVVFTDLLGLTTAPDQHIAIESVNPGIEVFDGEVAFQLRNGEVLAVQGGEWPFMGGALRLRPLDIRIGVEEARAYVMVIEGLEASRFVENMELGNLAATGIFDGTVPIIFDADGNGRLEGGLLVSRPPGGHVAYVGELTYEDMGFFANYAFSALRDLTYDSMQIGMNGPLTGELVTQVRFEGIGQGETAESNLVTRALDDLPIELRINIRAPFYKLINSIRALYDPAAVRDPRDLGLITNEGLRLREEIDQETVDEQEAREAEEAEQLLRDALDPDNNDIQPQESEPVP